MTRQGGSAMSMTLNLADKLLAMGRHRQELGRDADAVHFLDRLAGFREIPAEISEEALARLAEILLRQGRIIRARRHLTALLTRRPNSAHYHFLLARAYDGDEKSDPRRAAEHYRQSLKLDPKQPRCLGELGLLLLRLGQAEEGLRSLRKAVAWDGADPETVGRLVEGLRQEGETEEARSVLRVALFGHARDSRFRKLWHDFHFDELRQEQEAARKEDGLPASWNGGPRILPFVRPQEATADGKFVRRDPAASPQPPHTPHPSRLPDKKHA